MSERPELSQEKRDRAYRQMMARRFHHHRAQAGASSVLALLFGGVALLMLSRAQRHTKMAEHIARDVGDNISRSRLVERIGQLMESK